MYEIEKNVPVPTTKSRVYPLADMAVGDSFKVSAADRNKVATTSYMYGSRSNKKFSTKKHGDAYRCWRIA